MKRFLLLVSLLAMMAVSAPAFPPAVAIPTATSEKTASPQAAASQTVSAHATVASVQPPAAGPSAKQAINYSRDIEPILSANCYKCHGPDAEVRQAGLRLDERKSAIGVLESGDRAIVPGKPGEGELVRRIFSTDPDERMPPPKSRHQLSAAQKNLLKQWVAGGAVVRSPLVVRRPGSAAAAGGAEPNWPRNPIDRFVLARLEREGLKPSPEADKATLIRRVTLDLTGLPPTPAEVDAFLADTSRRRLRKGGRSAARLAALRRADGAGLARRGPLCRHARLPHRLRPRHVALARLGDRRVQSQHAVRPIHDRAIGRRPVAQCHARAGDRQRVQPQQHGQHRRGRDPRGISRTLISSTG